MRDQYSCVNAHNKGKTSPCSANGSCGHRCWSSRLVWAGLRVPDRPKCQITKQGLKMTFLRVCWLRTNTVNGFVVNGIMVLAMVVLFGFFQIDRAEAQCMRIAESGVAGTKEVAISKARRRILTRSGSFLDSGGKCQPMAIKCSKTSGWKCTARRTCCEAGTPDRVCRVFRGKSGNYNKSQAIGDAVNDKLRQQRAFMTQLGYGRDDRVVCQGHQKIECVTDERVNASGNVRTWHDCRTSHRCCNR